MLRRFFQRLRARRIARIRRDRQNLVCQAFSGKAGSLTARHKLQALTVEQLKLELGR